VTSPDIPGEAAIPGEGRLRLRGFLYGLIPLPITGVILFIASGTLAWPAAWFILGMLFVSTAVVSATCHTDLVMERTREQPGAKEYDKKLVLVLHLTGLLSLFVAGLDFRFGWTGPIAFPVQAAAFIACIAGYCLFSWAMISNRFFSTIARIQEERGHYPVITGPYRFVRHPGYLGIFINGLAQPLVLGSLWAVIPALITAGLIIWRTALEDRTLREELTGYREYAGQVRYRLVPGIW